MEGLRAGRQQIRKLERLWRLPLLLFDEVSDPFRLNRRASYRSRFHLSTGLIYQKSPKLPRKNSVNALRKGGACRTGAAWIITDKSGGQRRAGAYRSEGA